MPKLNLKAMAALEKQTLPKFEKIKKLVDEVNMDEEVRSNIAMMLEDQIERAKGLIMDLAWETKPTAPKKPRAPRKPKAVIEDQNDDL